MSDRRPTDEFVRLLVEKGRAGELREIAEEFEALVAAEERILDVELTTATELTDTEFGRILGRIESASGRKVQATRKVDPDLIGETRASYADRSIGCRAQTRVERHGGRGVHEAHAASATRNS